MEEQPEPFTLEGDPSVISNEQTTVFVNQAPVLPVQKNKASEVIGWLVLIWSGFGLLMVPFTIFSDFGATDFDGNPISYPTSYFVVTILTGLASSIMGIIGGWKMTKYEKQGIWIIFGSFAVSWAGGMVSQFIVGDAMGSAELGAGLGIMSGVCGIFCYAICGVIVAIPLMLSDGGME
ncbi:MAG TPA: hypothetical protein QF508_02865 [Candidatus Thalassarchaeaceae archaeon]|nr:hypothetical protein [Candidatus Thalassarchaeaceae archaeon]